MCWRRNNRRYRDVDSSIVIIVQSSKGNAKVGNDEWIFVDALILSFESRGVKESFLDFSKEAVEVNLFLGWAKTVPKKTHQTTLKDDKMKYRSTTLPSHLQRTSSSRVLVANHFLERRTQQDEEECSSSDYNFMLDTTCWTSEEFCTSIFHHNYTHNNTSYHEEGTSNTFGNFEWKYNQSNYNNSSKSTDDVSSPRTT